METKKKVHEQVLAQISAAIVGALGLVVGLAWNDAIKSLIEFFYPAGQGGLPAKFIYAAVLTVLVTTIIIIFTRWFEKKEEAK